MDEIVRAPIYREVHHDMSKADADSLADARLRLADVGGRRAGKATVEEIWEEEHIAEDGGRARARRRGCATCGQEKRQTETRRP